MKRYTVLIAAILAAVAFVSCREIQVWFYINNVEEVYRGLPRIYIEVEDGSEISLKNYYDALIRIDGGEGFEDVEACRVKVECRGNFTYTLPKKAFNLLFDDNTSLLGLDSAKQWTLLANYIDPSMSMTAAAMKLGEYMQVPHVNHIIPVDVIINGTYRGNYNLTEPIEIDENRVPLSEDGYILELDVYYDSSPKYLSSLLSLPVMLKDGNYTQSQFNQLVTKEFDELEAALLSPEFPNNNYRDLIDIESVAAFMLTNQYMMSNEVPSIKSIFFYKDVEDKFYMAPIWDFDFAGGYESTPGNSLPFLNWSWDIFSADRDATALFGQFFKDPEFVELYIDKWNEFESNHKEEFLSFVEEHLALIEESAEADYEVWNEERADYEFESYALQRDRFSIWLRERFDAVGSINSAL